MLTPFISLHISNIAPFSAWLQGAATGGIGCAGMNGAVAQELDRLVRQAVEQMREPIRKLEAEERIIAYHSDYPSLS